MTLRSEKMKKIVALINRGDKTSKICLLISGLKPAEVDKIRLQINPATPETKRKLKRDPLLLLLKKGKLSIHDLDAADYIRCAYMLIVGGITARNANYGDFIDNSGIAKMMEETTFQVMIQKQYKEWRELCKRKRIAAKPVMHVLTEPVSLTDTDRYFSMRRGSSSELLCRGLNLYSDTFHPGRSY